MFLEDLQAEVPALVVVEYEVSSSEANRDLFRTAAAEHGIQARAVPTIFLADRHWVGWTEQVGEEIRTVVEAELVGEPGPPADGTSPVVEVPFLGDVDLTHRSLLASTLVIWFADGFNPCSFWVLSLLLALVLRTRSRRRVLAVGVTFLVVTSALYAIYVGGVLSVLSYIHYVEWIRLAVAALAAAFGVSTLKEDVAPEWGPSLSIPTDRRPEIYRRMRAISSLDASLAAVLLKVASGSPMLTMAAVLVLAPGLRESVAGVVRSSRRARWSPG